MNSGIRYSHFDIDYLKSIVKKTYERFQTGPFEFRLWNNGFNIIYLVYDDAKSWVFRLRPNYSFYDITDFSVDFVLNYQNFLLEKGLSVPAIMRTGKKELYGHIKAPEGNRYFSLHEVIPGNSYFPLSRDQLGMIGKQLAEMHILSRGFTYHSQRLYFTKMQMLDRPLEFVMQNKDLLKDRYTWLINLIEATQDKLRSIEFEDFVIIHGDFWHGNVLLHNGHPSIIDFDYACYAPKELDIASFLILGYQSVLTKENGFKQMEKMIRSLIHGYEREWGTDLNISLLYHLSIARLIWTIGGYMAVIGIQSYAGVKKRLKELMQILQYLVTVKPEDFLT